MEEKRDQPTHSSDFASLIQKPRIEFAKIVPSPTATSWSQVYNAGNLYVIVSLNSQNADSVLPAVGKELINHLEEEFFTLEEKNLASIKQAISTIKDKVPEDVTVSLILAFIPLSQENQTQKNVLYIFLLGIGSIYLKRGHAFGSLLTSHEHSSDILAASGHIYHNDIVVLQTDAFQKLISKEHLVSSLQLANIQEAAETIAPIIHEHEEGNACGLLLHYLTPSTLEKSSEDETENNTEPPYDEDETISAEKPTRISTQNLSSFFPLKLPLSMVSLFGLSHTKKLLLSIAVILIVVFVTSIYFSVKKQAGEKNRAAFEQIAQPAQKKYDEGQSLVGLNKNLARDNFASARKIVRDGKPKLDSSSKEYTQLEELEKKIEDALRSASEINAVTPQETDASNSLLLSQLMKGASAVTQNETTVYRVTNEKVVTIDNSSQKEKEILKNDNSWKKAIGAGVFGSNFYILDADSNMIFKFVPAGSSYAKQNYFAAGANPDISNAIDMAIDGSVYVLTNSGILKFTKGKADPFTISSLDTPLSNPKKIVTSTDMSALYILDSGNSRIIVLNKDGSYKEQYKTDLLKNAEGIDVVEKDLPAGRQGKKIYILTRGKVYEIDIK